MGSMDSRASSFTPGSIPASSFRALSSIADEQPRSGEVLPRTIRPSSNSMAAAGAPVLSASSSAGRTTGRSARSRPSLPMSRPMRADCTGSPPCFFSATSAL